MKPADTVYPPCPRDLLAARFARHGGAVVSANERRIAAKLWQAPEQTRAALTTQMNLTQQSVHRLLTTLQDEGLILFGPLVPPKHKGKPSPQVLLNPRFGCAFGVSLDTDALGVTCMDFAGGHVTRQIAIDGDSIDIVLDRLDDAFAALLAQTRFTRADVMGIGFAISGYLMKNGRYNPPLPLAPWSEVDLARTVSDRFGLPCWTDNTANTAALSEAMFGLGRRYRDFAYLSFNYGFGAGIISDGDLHRGAFGNAGEISLIFNLDETDRRPALGVLLAHLRGQGLDVRSIADLDRLVDPMHPAVLDWVARVSPQMNRALNVLMAIVDPACIVFGGQIPRPLAQAFIDRAEFFARPRHGHINPLPDLAVTSISGPSASIGAACLPMRALAF